MNRTNSTLSDNIYLEVDASYSCAMEVDFVKKNDATSYFRFSTNDKGVLEVTIDEVRILAKELLSIINEHDAQR